MTEDLGIAALTQLMPPDHGTNEGIDWAAVEASLGTCLPADYMEFMATYGGGGINEVTFIAPPLPVAAGACNPGSIEENTPGAQATWHATPPAWRPAIDPADILAWGFTSGPDLLCWVTCDPDPDHWPVLVCGRHTLARWTLYPYGMTQFLLRLLRNEYEDAISINDTSQPHFVHWREQERRWHAGLDPFTGEPDPYAEMYPSN